MNDLYRRLSPFLKKNDPKPGKKNGTQADQIWIKVDYDRALVRREKIAIGNPVTEENGTVYLPVTPFCLFSGVRVSLTGGGAALLRGKEKLLPKHSLLIRDDRVLLDCRDADALFGLKHYYNPEIGLLIYSDRPMDFKNDDYTSLKGQIYDLSALLFEPPTAERLYADVLAHTGAGKHPRLSGGTDEVYDRVLAAFRTEEPTDAATKNLHDWAHREYRYLLREYEKYFLPDDTEHAVFKSREAELLLRQPYYIYDESGNRLVGVKSYTYVNGKGETVTEKCSGSGYGDGYDYGGRSCSEPCYCADIFSLLWRITGQNRFREAYFRMANAAAGWEHWGEGHFLDCSADMRWFAEGLDLMWHEMDEMPDLRAFYLKTLYEKGICAANHCIRDEKDKIHISTINYQSWKGIHRRGNNWNSVCTHGILVAALLLIDEEAYRDEALFAATTMLDGMKLCVYQYAPDGAYIESPSYWAYGTGAYMGILERLLHAAGTTYGFERTVGLRDSFRFAMNICDNKGFIWGYHDGDGDYPMPTDTFPFAAKLFGDPSISDFRNNLLRIGGNGGNCDLLYTDPTLPEATSAAPLDYFSRGIETATFRNSWDPGNFLFTGLHVGANWALHGDSDSGTFILRMGGVTWFDDPGTENYNVGGYWGDDPRYRYYNKSLESHNTLLIRTPELPHGQVFNKQTDPYAKMIRFDSAESGGFAVADMTVQFGKTCAHAERGLWLTDDRETVILQDELSFTEPTDAIWVATPAPAVNRYFPRYKTPANKNDPKAPAPDLTFEDGNRRVLIRRTDEDGTVHTLRVSIVSDNKTLHFETIPAETTLFDDTITRENSGNGLVSDVPERLAIRLDKTTDVTFAVVMEPAGKEKPCDYVPVPMRTWKNP